MSLEKIQNQTNATIQQQKQIIDQQFTLIQALKVQMCRLQNELSRVQKDKKLLTQQLNKFQTQNGALKQKIAFLTQNNQSLLQSFQALQRELIKRDYNSLVNRSTIDFNPNSFFLDLISTVKNKMKTNSKAPLDIPKKSKISDFYSYFFQYNTEMLQVELLNDIFDTNKKTPTMNQIKSFGKKNLFNQNYRHIFWSQVIENKLNISVQYYNLIEAQLSSYKDNNKPTNNILSQDLRRMDVRLQIQQSKSVLNEIKKCLQLFEIYRPDIGYIQGMTYIAWMIIIRMNGCNSFICFSNIMLTDPFINSLYQFNQEKIKKITNFFEMCLNDKKPKLLKHMKTLSVEFDLFLIEWAYTFFTRAFNLRISSKIWDLWLCQGFNVFYKVCMTIMDMIEGQILQKNQNDKIIELIRTSTHQLDQQVFIKLLLKQKLFQDLKL